MEENCSNRCRACLSENDSMLSLFDVYEHDLTLAMILKSCIKDVQVAENDGLPSYLCDNCILVLTQFYNFTVVYEESGQYLRSLFKKNIELLPISLTSSVDISSLKEEQREEALQESEENLINSSTIFFVESDVNVEEKTDALDIKVETPEGTNDLQSDVEKLETKVSDNTTVYEDVTKYDCNICGEAHLYAASFQQHMRVKHRITDIDCQPYSSAVKVRVFEVPKKKVAEIQKLETVGSYFCKFCNKQCAYEGQLQQHLRSHEAPKKFVCEVCGARFVRKTYLDDHKEGHSLEKKHVCKFCGKAFRRRTVLRAHKRVHTHPNHYVCELCGRAFTNSSTLKTHKLLIHVRERKFQCMICNLNFPLKSTLTKHLLRHQKRENGEKGFPCNECPMQYKDKSSLKRHVESKHQGMLELIPCYDCPKRYTSKANLMKHIRRHHNGTVTIAEEVIV
ncbi:hypothetical protein FQA39_LY05962 [Lamprigera yunnana]|nr:hypothetical protein FQA39_LY05962 [Lamprigera yunnana]